MGDYIDAFHVGVAHFVISLPEGKSVTMRLTARSVYAATVHEKRYL